MSKRTIKITLKLPTGILASKELEQITTQAAQVALAAAIAELTEAQKKQLENAIKKQDKFMSGDVQKKKLSKKNKSQLIILRDRKGG